MDLFVRDLGSNFFQLAVQTLSCVVHLLYRYADSFGYFRGFVVTVDFRFEHFEQQLIVGAFIYE